MSDVIYAGLDLVQIGKPSTIESWLVSDWNAGQTKTMEFARENVSANADGSIKLTLGASADGATRPYAGGEVQSMESSSFGTWTWTVQAPEMVGGAVLGLFTYRESHYSDPWIEFDFEFVGADTTQVRLNIHMETATGEHVTLEQANGWRPVVVDLGFDASQGMHTYEIVVTETEAHFLVDGQVVGNFDAQDMPYNTWITGDMKGFTNLWCVDPSLSHWAGAWADPALPLEATIATADVRPGDLGAFGPADGPIEPSPEDPAIHGDDADNELVGTKSDDIFFGEGGDDIVRANGGNDHLSGGSGHDTLRGGAGADTLVGGAGKDNLFGGRDGAQDIFVFGGISESGLRSQADVIRNFEIGFDKIDLSGIDAHMHLAGQQDLSFSDGSAAAHSVWVVEGRKNTILRIDVTGDAKADMEIKIAGGVLPLLDDFFL